MSKYTQIVLYLIVRATPGVTACRGDKIPGSRWWSHCPPPSEVCDYDNLYCCCTSGYWYHSYSHSCIRCSRMSAELNHSNTSVPTVSQTASPTAPKTQSQRRQTTYFLQAVTGSGDNVTSSVSLKPGPDGYTASPINCYERHGAENIDTDL